MKTLGFLLFVLSLAFYVMPGVLAGEDKPKDDGKEDGGKLGKVEEKKAKKPFPATFAFKDYRLEMKTKDGRWWKHDRKYTENDEKAGTVLKLRFKLPKSDEIFDADIFVRGFTNKTNLQFPDGTSIGAGSAGRLAEKFFEGDVGPNWKRKDYTGGSWKEVKKESVEPVRKVKRFCKGVKSGYSYSFIAQHPTANIPLKLTCYVFTHKDMTYVMNVLLTTGAANNERVTDEVDALIKSLDVRKKKRH